MQNLLFLEDVMKIVVLSALFLSGVLHGLDKKQELTDVLQECALFKQFRSTSKQTFLDTYYENLLKQRLQLLKYNNSQDDVKAETQSVIIKGYAFLREEHYIPLLQFEVSQLTNPTHVAQKTIDQLYDIITRLQLKQRTEPTDAIEKSLVTILRSCHDTSLALTRHPYDKITGMKDKAKMLDEILLKLFSTLENNPEAQKIKHERDHDGVFVFPKDETFDSIVAEYESLKDPRQEMQSPSWFTKKIKGSSPVVLRKQKSESQIFPASMPRQGSGSNILSMLGGQLRFRSRSQSH